MGRISSTVLYPAWVLVLIVLHVCFALGRLRRLLRQLPALLRSQLRRSNVLQQLEDEKGVNLNLEAEKRRWKKTPTHLAVLFHPGMPVESVSSWFSWSGSTSRQARRAEVELAQLSRMTDELRKLVRWCDGLGIAQLSPSGILDRFAPAVEASLSSSCVIIPESTPSSETRRHPPLHAFRLAFSTPMALKSSTGKRVRFQTSSSDGTVTPPGREIDSGYGLSDLGSETPIATSSVLSVNLLSRRSGRPHLASIARQLAEGQNLGHSIEEAIEAGSFSEPDLLLVLGGPYLRLRGFPPWQLRLTEM
ncbi:BZ3500_MvSof-1268-A1-R1_Chr2-2g04998 [Microbotryum saponariae]|uniref:ditrans,polycis-polyprenyl diphosphate synthase [(2E,6E)-farnesyldiphosphate specific] n=1 Tax=Microbotryum saponariae TaxID=289078 RepID=A0A2X0L295_9BASI|nr:BZ3500_MvSof-1268-A1-R1_Chr2-2g04998 [Microbotryum saponariae]SDA00671.1 BZ3501_MvSof-1269-A2-R1_Chr2-2g04672 [Microbotryum saponariae]